MIVQSLFVKDLIPETNAAEPAKDTAATGPKADEREG
jgi:hypothetical protein